MTKSADKVFDRYASDYDTALARGISIFGENRNYFARRRVEWLYECLLHLSFSPKQVMDYGCGTGLSSPFLLETLGAEHLIGTDESLQSLNIARQSYGSERIEFLPIDTYLPSGKLDLVFCNGVFHHIPSAKRAEATDYVFRSLRPAGLFAFWENNPWNPGTLYAMSRTPFDRDAVPLTPPEARNLLRGQGFEVIQTDFLFIFPRVLHWCRWIEPFWSRYPLGAQYQILCRKPL
jgi:SAM-dependent methyltransferase